MKKEKERKSNKKLLAVAGALIIVVITATSIVFVRGKAKKEPETQVNTVALEKRDLEKSISITGTVASAQVRTVTSELTDTKVNSVSVKAGDMVKAGDVIAVLDSTGLEEKLQITREAVKAAEEKNRIEKNAAARNVQNAKESEVVETQRGKENAKDAQTAYQKAQSELERAKAEYTDAENRRKAKEGEAARVRREQEESQKRLKSWDEKQAAYQKEYENKAAELKNIEANVGETEKNLSTARENYERAVSAYESISKEDESKREELAAAVAQMEEKKNLRDQAQAARDQAAAEQSRLTGELNEIQTSRNSAKDEYQKAAADAAAKEERKAALENAAAAAKEEAAAKEGAIRQSDGGAFSAQSEYKRALQQEQDAVRNTKKALEEQKDSLAGLTVGEAVGNLQEKIDIRKYERQIEECIIKAPVDGMVTSVGIKEGDSYKGGEIVTIQSPDSYIITAVVDQYDISNIKTGMQAVIETEVMGEEKMTGELKSISPVPKLVQTEKGTGTDAGKSEYPIEVTIHNPNEKLRFGMTTKTSIVENAVKDAWVVPYTCVLSDENGQNFIQAAEGETVKKIEVKKGLETDYYVQILGEGLKEGIQIIVPESEGADE